MCTAVTDVFHMSADANTVRSSSCLNTPAIWASVQQPGADECCVCFVFLVGKRRLGSWSSSCAMHMAAWGVQPCGPAAMQRLTVWPAVSASAVLAWQLHMHLWHRAWMKPLRYAACAYQSLQAVDMFVPCWCKHLQNMTLQSINHLLVHTSRTQKRGYSTYTQQRSVPC